MYNVKFKYCVIYLFFCFLSVIINDQVYLYYLMNVNYKIKLQLYYSLICSYTYSSTQDKINENKKLYNNILHF